VKKKTLRCVVAAVVGLASDCVPVFGMLGAALVFPQGAEGDHGFAYLALALVLNFVLFFGITYWIVGRLLRTRHPR
jgi:predicted permease